MSSRARYLEDDEAVDAETFVNRASGLMHACGHDWSLQLRYRVTLARVLDSRRKFLDAALRYYELSQTAQEAVLADDLLELLGKAVTCSILGNAGPQRSRMLGTLYKDERSHSLPNYPMLEKMYKEGLLRPDEGGPRTRAQAPGRGCAPRRPRIARASRTLDPSRSACGLALHGRGHRRELDMGAIA